MFKKLKRKAILLKINPRAVSSFRSVLFDLEFQHNGFQIKLTIIMHD